MVITVKNMGMDFEDVTPEEFHDFALELNEIKNDLDSSDSIINRTINMRIYYSVFLFLREWLKKYTKYILILKGNILSCRDISDSMVPFPMR